MRKAVMMAVILLIAFSLISCATWKEGSTLGYETTGMMLKEIHDSAKSLCDSGTLKAEDCENIKVIYGRARAAYITSGDALIMAINADDAIMREKNLDAYKKSLSEISVLVPKLIKLLGDMGISIGGK